MRVVSFRTTRGEAVTFTAVTPLVMFEQFDTDEHRRNVVQIMDRQFVVEDQEWDAILDRLLDPRETEE